MIVFWWSWRLRCLVMRRGVYTEKDCALCNMRTRFFVVDKQSGVYAKSKAIIQLLNCLLFFFGQMMMNHKIRKPPKPMMKSSSIADLRWDLLQLNSMFLSASLNYRKLHENANEKYELPDGLENFQSCTIESSAKL